MIFLMAKDMGGKILDSKNLDNLGGELSVKVSKAVQLFFYVVTLIFLLWQVSP